MSKRFAFCLLLLISCLTLQMPVCAEIILNESDGKGEKRAIDYFDLPLSDLMKMQVKSPSRRHQDLSHSPSAISVITRDEILKSPAHTIPELLQYVVGLDTFIKTYTDMDVAARGRAHDDTSRMLVMIDDQVVNVVPFGGMQWPTLPLTLDDIDRIEILRGVGIGVYTATSLAGIIQIYTIPVEKRDSLKMSLSYGEGGTSHNSLQFAKPLSENWGFAGTLHYVQTERKGDKETSEATAVAPNWKIKDWASIKGVNFRADYQSGDFDYHAYGGMTTDQEGYNASPGDHAIDRSEKETLVFSNWLHQDLANSDVINLRLGYRELWQRNERFDNNQYVFKYKVEKGDGLDIDLQYNISRFNQHSLMLGLNYVYLKASREINNISEPYVYDESDILHALYIQDQFFILDNKIQLTLGGRYDKWDNLDREFTPRLVANIFLIPGELTLRVASTTSFAQQTFDGGYYFAEFGPPNTGWFKGSTITATTNNSGEVIEGAGRGSEKMIAHELGLRWQPTPDTMVTTEYYYNKVSDVLGLVVYDTVPVGDIEIPNLGAATTDQEHIYQGVELEIQTKVSDNVSGFFNYTYQWGDDSSGNTLEFFPENKASAGVRYFNYFDFDIRARYVSEVTYSEVPSVPADSYSSVDIAISKLFANQLFAKLSAINLMDNQHYEYPIYTQITRKAMLTIKYSF